MIASLLHIPYEGPRMQRPFSRQPAAMNRVIPQRPNHLLFRVVEFDRTDEALRNRGDFAVVDATARNVPDV